MNDAAALPQRNFDGYCFKVSSSGMVIEAYKYSGSDEDMSDNFHRCPQAIKLALFNASAGANPSQDRLDDLNDRPLEVLQEAVDKL